MLRPDRGIERVYLHCAPVDMRRQIDGLAILARDVIKADPLSGAMFAFINARRNKLKIPLFAIALAVAVVFHGGGSYFFANQVGRASRSRSGGKRSQIAPR
jgi:IS66 Orf2 like protein